MNEVCDCVPSGNGCLETVWAAPLPVSSWPIADMRESVETTPSMQAYPFDPRGGHQDGHRLSINDVLS